MPTSDENCEHVEGLTRAAEIIADLKARLRMAEELGMDVFRKNLSKKVDKDLFFLGRQRAQLFPEQYFSYSMWDILLELYRAHDENRWLAVTDIGIMSNIAPTAMLRYLTKLESDGHIVRQDVETDKMRQLFKMDDSCKDIMIQLFDDFTQKLTDQGRYRRKGKFKGLAA